jgi:hypothetical protein
VKGQFRVLEVDTTLVLSPIRRETVLLSKGPSRLKVVSANNEWLLASQGSWQRHPPSASQASRTPDPGYASLADAHPRPASRVFTATSQPHTGNQALSTGHETILRAGLTWPRTPKAARPQAPGGRVPCIFQGIKVVTAKSSAPSDHPVYATTLVEAKRWVGLVQFLHRAHLLI